MTAEGKAKFKKIYNVISTVILAVVFVFLVLVVIVTIVGKQNNKDTKLFGHYVYVVASDSMNPTLVRGDAIWSAEPTAESVKEGAIITFVAPSGAAAGHNITHRIVRIETGDDGLEHIYTKGDNPSANEDSWSLSRSDVKAVYQKNLVVISGLMKFILEYNFLAYVVLIVVPLLVVGVLFIVGYVNDRVKAEKASVPSAPQDGGVRSLDEMSEEEKKKLLDEFLKEQQDKDSTDGD